MQFMRANTLRQPARQRGTIYVLVLGVVSLLVVLGVAGAMSARVTVQRGKLEQEQLRARLLAESYLDLIHKRINGTTLWRNLHINNTWSNPAEIIDGCRLQYKFVDEQDANLSNNTAQPFRLYAKASIGNAVRVLSIELMPDGSGGNTRNLTTLRREAAN